ncbi:tripartite tricarboxylate transporter substrate binding protein [Chachezhania sediminis]|uniref:tripartite tricarboxylate transporter substrate binding protein n=1 Tax=Chachezhania sediminis TaxID=2599291 RepID=UPI00131E6A08|nr:tripartite tricarboxylate transporter substrate binding protein [Chachezhania sediminis]
MKRLLAGLAALALTAAPALADWSPKGPINLYIGFGAGGETDTLGRLVAEEMKQSTGWNIVVDNKPGGGGMAMFTQLNKMPPTGQFLGMGVTMPVLVNLTIRPDEVPFTLDSFTYIGTVALAELAIVAPADAPFDDLAGLIEFSKANGGATIGFDAPPQKLLVDVVNAQSGADMRLVSMESSAEAVQNLLGGHVTAAFNAGSHIPYLETGELKMIAGANETRPSYSPDTPTVEEAGFGVYVDPWYYIAAPKGLPEEAQTAIGDALKAALDSDTVKTAIENTMHTEPVFKGPAETRAMMEAGLANVKTLFGK